MGWWQVDADALAGSRFVISPLAEVVAAMIALDTATAIHPAERRWLDTHLPAFHARLADDPITALLLRSVWSRRWIADFIWPVPHGTPSFSEELARVRRTPPETARADIEVVLKGPLPPELHRSDLAERAADLQEWVWTETVLPGWPRRRGILEADIVARTGQLSKGGWAAALNDMRPGMRWLGGSRLQINTMNNPPRDLGGARLMFVPVTPRQSLSAWDPETGFALLYPCSGTLAEPDRAAVPEALGRLLGPARAGVLVLLGTPKSTSQLVALTGQGLGSVGRHLKVLLDAGLAARRRAGRSVLYYRTNAGDVLANAVGASELSADTIRLSS
jgi:DNA-binding transcriptional ArsR family regulator